MNAAFMSYAPGGGPLRSPITSHGTHPEHRSIEDVGLDVSFMIN